MTRLRTLAGLALLGAAVLTATPAHAATNEVTCGGTSSGNTISYSPSLTAASQQTGITYRTMYRGCSSSDPGARSGIAVHTRDRQYSCPALLSTESLAYDIDWMYAGTSSVQVTRTASISGGVLTVQHYGYVASGTFAGSTVYERHTMPAGEIQKCIAGSTNIPSTFMTVTLTISAI
ncbi:hypothetical protein [Longispora albida]|uniref:hypothetical protein n=1 Tax=Longispora albida TaxID=203523 RepID=UPI0003771674|nr:hypothetical protein [Longispora albida]